MLRLPTVSGYLALAAALFFTVTQRSAAQFPPRLAMEKSPEGAVLSVTGDLGSPCTVQYNTNFPPSGPWLSLTNFLLQSNPTAITDLVPPAPQRRFYRVAVAEPTNAFDILNRIASNTVAACAFIYANGDFIGTNSWRPSAGGEYEEFCVRDTVMAMRSAPWLFTDADVQNICNQTASLYTPDHDILVAMSTWGDAFHVHPQVDHSFEFIDILYEHYRRTGRPTAFTQYLEPATNTFAYQQVSNHLVFLDPPDNKIGFGFEDSIQIYGYSLTCSLYRYRACQEMAQMFSSLGRPAEALYYTNELPLIRTNLEAHLYDPARRLFYAASLADSVMPIYYHELFGSAYAVVLGAARPAVLDAVAAQLADVLDTGAYKNGAIRHLPVDEDWSDRVISVVYQGTYQNGGYWPEFTAWCAQAIRRVNPPKADRLMGALALRYAGLDATTSEAVPYEAENAPDYFGARQYLASACLPLQYWSAHFNR
jgi:hypothetical protein